MNSLFESTYNPDVLSCIANLSNDEVFTPPELANQMLDMLPNELWNDPNATFLDPGCKSGVFLREIAKRLIDGLEDVYPDLQERLEHIYKKQLFGMAVTELTSLLARRSLYCSKYPNSKYSVVQFEEPQGRIDYRRIEHTWEYGRCRYCGVPKSVYDRGESLETYAYEFIHLQHPEEVFNMKFDVIVGNPPYQMNDGGGEGSSAMPLYHKFIQQAIKLNPRYLSMIVPARWYSGGKGLDEFRDSMLHDERLSVIHDFPETSLCFPGVNIRGGVCYFLWERDHKGPAEVFNHSSDAETTSTTRPLLEKGASTFIRYNPAIGILNKVQAFGEETYDQRVMARNPFGIPSNYADFLREPGKDTYTLYRSRRGSNRDKVVYIHASDVKKNHQLIPEIKVLVSKASPGGDEYPHSIFSMPLMGVRNSVCTETYLIVDVVKTEEEAQSLLAYMQTSFFRFLVSLIKTTQNISKGCFAFVPVQNLDHPWTDAELFEKYGITQSEQDFIAQMIKPINSGDGNA